MSLGEAHDDVTGRDHTQSSTATVERSEVLAASRQYVSEDIYARTVRSCEMMEQALHPSQPRLAHALNNTARISRLSDDILHLVFWAGQKDQFDTAEELDLYHDRDSAEPPFVMLVSFVCRRWRKVALSSCKLWTALAHVFGDPAGYLPLYLERSRRTPLSVRLIDILQPPDTYTRTPTESSLKEERPFYAEAFELVWGEAYRMELLGVYSEQRTCMYNIMPVLRGAHAPLLRNFILSVDFDSPWDWQSMSHSTVFGGGAPLLEHFATDMDLRSCWVPPGSLRSLKLTCWGSGEDISSQDFLRFLESCPGLESLFIYGGVVDSVPAGTDARVSLPRLKSMELMLDALFHDFSGSYELELFRLYADLLSTPHLEELHLVASKATRISRFLRRLVLPEGGSKYPNLKLLDISHADESCVDMDFIRAHPKVRELDLFYTNEDDVLRLLMADDPDDPLWPQLTDLHLGNNDLDLVRDFLSCRARLNVPIKRIHVGIHVANQFAGPGFTREQLSTLGTGVQFLYY